ncbi:MAG: hypothetical protein M1819_005914 [Sarea resinae]|nr:MAG: hypothetical protein M1819_005914 [Sarea resinae]
MFPTAKKRFEIACYKNKVLEWRSGVETDIDNVLQIPSIFLSVSKGQLAPAQDLAKAFGAKTSQDDIINEILRKGELQVGEKERHAQLERMHHEVVDIVAGKLIDPKSRRPYTTGMIEKALDQLSSQGHGTQSEGKAAAEDKAAAGADEDGEGKAKGKALPTWTGVVATRSAKSQALDAMKALIAHQPIPVARARMRLRITCPTNILKQAAKQVHHEHPKGDAAAEGAETTKGTVKDRILGYIEQVETQDVVGGEWEVLGFVEPGAYKGLDEFVGGETKGRGRIEVLDMAVGYEGD